MANPDIQSTDSLAFPTSRITDSYEDGDVDAHGTQTVARFQKSRVVNPRSLQTHLTHKTQASACHIFGALNFASYGKHSGPRPRARFPPRKTTKCSRGLGERANSQTTLAGRRGVSTCPQVGRKRLRSQKPSGRRHSSSNRTLYGLLTTEYVRRPPPLPQRRCWKPLDPLTLDDWTP